MSVIKPSKDTEEWIRCPYNNAHMIPYKRFAYHEKKCRQQVYGDNYELCPFNSQHVVEKHKYRHHVATCPDKGTIIESTVQAANMVIDKPHEYTYEVKEDWDEELGSGPTFIHPSQQQNAFLDHPEPVAVKPTRTRAPLQPPTGKPAVLSRIAPQTAALQDLHKGRGKPSAGNAQKEPRPGDSRQHSSSSAFSQPGVGRGSTGSIATNSSNGYHKPDTSTNGAAYPPLSVVTDDRSAVGRGHGLGSDPSELRSRPSGFGRGRAQSVHSSSSSASSSPVRGQDQPLNSASSPGRGRGLKPKSATSPGRGRGLGGRQGNTNVGSEPSSSVSSEPFRGIGRGMDLSRLTLD